MSQRLIARSPDLKKLQDLGYDISTYGAVLVVRDIPYLTSAGEVHRGILVTTLELADDVTINPVDDHVAFFAGEKPHLPDGRPSPHVIGESLQQTYGGVQVDIQLSSKPRTPDQKYRDYHHKVETYVRHLSRAARTVDASLSARASNRVIIEDEDETVFNYVDSASSRAGLEVITERLKVGAVAIVGLGGTGSYILDLLAKTPIGQIHLYDRDTFLQHNAFRAPGAPTNDQLAERPTKVKRFGDIYAALRREIVQHPYNVDKSTVDELRNMDFVFIAIDHGKSRKLIVERLEGFGVGFIDAGLGVKEKNSVLSGLVRTTTSTSENRSLKTKLSFGGGGEEDDYTRNIQIAELNALNAVLAVIKWKKLVGFYGDIENEYHSLYAINSNYLINTEATA
jgi:molybdopterin/thiamine biosynthesis adenylyltransferase